MTKREVKFIIGGVVIGLSIFLMLFVAFSFFSTSKEEKTTEIVKDIIIEQNQKQKAEITIDGKNEKYFLNLADTISYKPLRNPAYTETQVDAFITLNVNASFDLLDKKDYEGTVKTYIDFGLFYIDNCNVMNDEQITEITEWLKALEYGLESPEVYK